MVGEDTQQGITHSRPSAAAWPNHLCPLGGTRTCLSAGQVPSRTLQDVLGGLQVSSRAGLWEGMDLHAEDR